MPDKTEHKALIRQIEKDVRSLEKKAHDYLHAVVKLAQHHPKKAKSLHNKVLSAAKKFDSLKESL